jgi:hypothetical protein
MAFTNQIADTQAYEFIVAPVGTFSRYATVQEAIDDAVAQGYNEVTPTTVLLKSGTYTEDLVLHPGINIQGSEEGSTILLGVHTPPATGFVVFRDLILQSASDVLLDAATAGTAGITFDNCSFNINGYIVNMPNWTGDIIIDECNDTSVLNGIVNNAGGSLVEVKDSSLGAGFLKFTTSGITKIINSRIFISLDIKNATVVECGSYIEGVLTVDGSSPVYITNSRLSSGIASALILSPTFTDTVYIANTTIDCSGFTAIDGVGQIELCSVSFSDANTIAGTITYANNSSFNATKGKFHKLLEIEDGVLRVNGTDPEDGMVLIGDSSTNKPVWASITSSDNSISFTAGAGTLDMRASGGGLPFTVATADLTATPNTCYSIQHGTPATKLVVTLPDPVDSTPGDQIKIMGYTSGGWKVAQSDAAHQIILGNQSSTLGAAGYIEFTNQYDVILLTCIDGNVWQADAPQGNITVA